MWVYLVPKLALARLFSDIKSSQSSPPAPSALSRLPPSPLAFGGKSGLRNPLVFKAKRILSSFPSCSNLPVSQQSHSYPPGQEWLLGHL